MTLPPMPPPPSRRTRVLLPDEPATVQALREQRDDARNTLAVLEERQEAALRLHQKQIGFLLIHGGRTRPYCSAEGEFWPCATVRALTGDDEDGAQ